jgi:hypothetical protein
MGRDAIQSVNSEIVRESTSPGKPRFVPLPLDPAREANGFEAGEIGVYNADEIDAELGGGVALDVQLPIASLSDPVHQTVLWL